MNFSQSETSLLLRGGELNFELLLWGEIKRKDPLTVILGWPTGFELLISVTTWSWPLVIVLQSRDARVEKLDLISLKPKKLSWIEYLVFEKRKVQYLNKQPGAAEVCGTHEFKIFVKYHNFCLKFLPQCQKNFVGGVLVFWKLHVFLFCLVVIPQMIVYKIRFIFVEYTRGEKTRLSNCGHYLLWCESVD